MTAIRHRFLVPGVSTLVMLIILIGLGTWQVQRLHWKEAILARIATAEAAPAVPLAQHPSPYTKVSVAGRFLFDRTAQYGAEVRDPDERRTGAILRDVEPEDLLKFGLIPEFIGRLPVVATLEDLDEQALVEILTKPKNALVKQYGRLFEMEGVKLSFTDDALRSVATRAIARRTGARGLRSIMESILLHTMFDLPGLDNVDEVVINREVAEGRAVPLFTYSQTRERAESGA